MHSPFRMDNHEQYNSPHSIGTLALLEKALKSFALFFKRAKRSKPVKILQPFFKRLGCFSVFFGHDDTDRLKIHLLLLRRSRTLIGSIR